MSERQILFGDNATRLLVTDKYACPPQEAPNTPPLWCPFLFRMRLDARHIYQGKTTP